MLKGKFCLKNISISVLDPYSPFYLDPAFFFSPDQDLDPGGPEYGSNTDPDPG